MRKLIMKILAVVLSVIWLAACASYERQVVPFKMPSAYPNATSVADATIAAKSYDINQDATTAFGFDIRAAGILPVQVIFDNTGNHPLEILADKTLLVDEENNLWKILDQRMAYDRLSKATEFGKVAPEAAKRGLLAGAAGAFIGAAIGIVTGTNVASALGKGAAVGAAAGIASGGLRGLSDSDVNVQIQEDLKKGSLERRPIAPKEIAHGFLFFPGEAKKPKELRISIRETDTNQVYPLVMKF
jgi:outer membrane murein-binding lipoprotein Lpp